jgi:hypothetical protein
VTAGDLVKRAGGLTRHGRPPGRRERLTALVRRTAADIERGRRVERRRRRLRRLAVTSFAVGAGAAVVLARMGLPHRGPA